MLAIIFVHNYMHLFLRFLVVLLVKDLERRMLVQKHCLDN